MIKTPQAQRKRRFKTESGYKLRGAMVAAGVGVLIGLIAALAAFGLSTAFTATARAIFEPNFPICGDVRWLLFPFLTLTDLIAFTGVGFLLALGRRKIISGTSGRYGEFSVDVGNWFGLAAFMAYAVAGVPLLLVAVFSPCS